MAHVGGRDRCRSSLRASRSSLTLSVLICSKLLDKRRRFQIDMQNCDVENGLRNLRGLVEVGKAENVVSRIFHEEPFSHLSMRRSKSLRIFPLRSKSRSWAESFDVPHDPLQ